ncbi:MAG: ABC transporter permease subunit [Gammaproteobacteria bacterium]|nr:ABC transporter permease subunit [Gammaproteobacteria bacterium]
MSVAKFKFGRLGVISVPYVWMLLFFLVPFGFVLKISFAEMANAIPPYTDLYRPGPDGEPQLFLNLDNYRYLLEDELYVLSYLNSLKIAAISTLLCLLVGYPMAYAIANAGESWRNVFLMLVILPSWTSFLIRIYAWIGILKNEGLLNNALMSLGIIDSPLQILQTDLAVYIGIVYAYLPFMILPLYTNLVKHDYSLIEAAQDLGCSAWKAFLRITLPLSKGGIVAGSMLVFIPAVGEFVIPELLGGPDTLMIGKVLWNEFNSNRDWPVASAVACVMLVVLIVPLVFFQYVQNKELAKQEDGK